MCEGCSYWHGDYHFDILGRGVDKLERDIARGERTLEIRKGYSASNEGYSQRTAQIQRGIEMDRATLIEVRRRIVEHESSKTGKR